MLPSERIKLLIEAGKISYIELEKATGISKSALQRYAAGTTKKIPIDAVELIASALGVNPAYIMGWVDNDATACKSYVKRISFLCNELNDEGQAKVEDYAQDLVDSGKYKKGIPGANNGEKTG